MRLRELAKASGLQAASLYNYFASKEGFLFELMCEVMDEILADLEATVGPVTDPEQRMIEFVDFHIRWHTERRDETFISRMEMRSLSKEHYKVYLQLRKRYEDFVADILERGCETGVFEVRDQRIATLSILAMLTDVCNWFRPKGRLNQEQLIDIYVHNVLSMLCAGAKKAPKARSARVQTPVQIDRSAISKDLALGN